MISTEQVVSGVWRVENSGFSSNTYICQIAGTDHCLVVDPGLDQTGVLSAIEGLQLRPLAVACTHGHFDHVGSASTLMDTYKIPLYLHTQDVKLSKSANFLLMACKIDQKIKVPTVSYEVDDGFETSLLGQTLRFVHVPGHTNGSCFLEFQGCLFTGDSLYKRGVGLVDFPGEKPAVLKESLLKIWDRFPDHYHVCPGHGGTGAWGDIKLNNLRLRAFLGLDSATSEAQVGATQVKKTGAAAKQAFDEELK